MRCTLLLTLGLTVSFAASVNAQDAQRGDQDRPRERITSVPEQRRTQPSQPLTPEQRADLSESVRRLTNDNPPSNFDMRVRVKLAREGYVYIEDSDAYVFDPPAAEAYLQSLYHDDQPVPSFPQGGGVNIQENNGTVIIGNGAGAGAGYDLSDVTDAQQGIRGYADGSNGPGFYTKERWYQWHLAQRRGTQLRDANRTIVDEGMRFFRMGDYQRAAITWLRASELDQGDAASRLAAGHALFALGRYSEANRLLAHAFELTPQLASLSYDIRKDYGNVRDFDEHLAALERFVAANPRDYHGRLLLGYILSYTYGPGYGYEHLQPVIQTVPSDSFAQKLWATAQMVGPATTPRRERTVNAQQGYAPMQPTRFSDGRPRIQKMRPTDSRQPQRAKNNPSATNSKPQSNDEPEKMRLVND